MRYNDSTKNNILCNQCPPHDMYRFFFSYYFFFPFTNDYLWNGNQGGDDDDEWPSYHFLPMQGYSVEDDPQPKKTDTTTIYCSAVAVHASIGHGQLYVDVTEVVGSVTRIAWRKHSLMTRRVCFTKLALFVFSLIGSRCQHSLVRRDRIYTWPTCSKHSSTSQTVIITLIPTTSDDEPDKNDMGSHDARRVKLLVSHGTVDTSSLRVLGLSVLDRLPSGISAITLPIPYFHYLNDITHYFDPPTLSFVSIICCDRNIGGPRGLATGFPIGLRPESFSSLMIRLPALLPPSLFLFLKPFVLSLIYIYFFTRRTVELAHEKQRMTTIDDEHFFSLRVGVLFIYLLPSSCDL